MTQKDAILTHLKDFGEITSYEAFQEYGVTRLSAVIFVLKEMGYGIGAAPVKRTNRFGNKVTFAKYFLLPDGSVKRNGGTA